MSTLSAAEENAPTPPADFKTARDRVAPEGKTKHGDAYQSVYDQIVGILKTCYDPEIPVDIFELGLIYEIKINDDATVDVDMTLTSPMCPVAESLPPEVEHKIEGLPAVDECRIEVIWEPTWSPAMMSEEAKLDLGLDDY